MKRLLALIALAFFFFPSAAFAATPTAITVNGTGTISLPPDQATVNAMVTTNNDSSATAVSENNALYDKIVASAVSAGARRDDITLNYYNVNYFAKPSPDATPQPYQKYGYTVTRSFSIKVHSIASAGSMVDALSRAGVTNIEGVNFGLAQPEKARRSATDKAVADARQKADELAHSAGLHIVGIKSIDLENAGGGVRPMPVMRMAAQAPTPTAFDPGSVSVNVNVTVVFSAVP